MVMGTINAILPLAVLVAKPTFGYLIDLFHKQRKILFMILIGVMATGFSMLALIPARCHTECPDSLVSGNQTNFDKKKKKIVPHTTNTNNEIKVFIENHTLFFVFL